MYLLCSEILLLSALLGVAGGVVSTFGTAEVVTRVGTAEGALAIGEVRNLSGQQIKKMLSLSHLV